MLVGRTPTGLGVWNAETLEKRSDITTEIVEDLEVIPLRIGFLAGDKQVFATETPHVAAYDTIIRTWDWKTGKATEVIEPRGPVNALDIHGHIMALGFYDGSVSMWDTEEKRFVNRFVARSISILLLRFIEGGERFVTVGMNQVATIHDAETGEALKSLIGHEGEIAAMDVASEGMIVTGSHSDGSLRLWSADAKGHRQIVGDALAIGYDLESEYLMYGCSQGVVPYDPQSMTKHPPIPMRGFHRIQDLERGGRMYPYHYKLGHMGAYRFIAQVENGAASVYDAISDEEVHRHKQTNPIEIVSFSNDASLLAVAGERAELQLLDTKSWETKITFPSRNETVREIWFSPTNHKLGVVYGANRVVVYDLKTSSTIEIEVEEKEIVTAMAFSFDEQWVAIGSLSGTIQLFSFTELTNVHSFRAHIGGGVTYLCFSPDDLTLASIGIRKVKLWNVHTGQHLIDLLEPGPKLSGAFVEFSPSGESLTYSVYQNEFGIVHAPFVDVSEVGQ